MHADQRYVSVHNDLVGLYASEINTATQVVVEIRKTPRICVITPPRQAPTALSALRLDARSDDGDGRRVILSSDQIKGVEISNSNDQKADAFASIANFAPVKNLTTVQLGVSALRWTAGDDAANLQAMIEVSVANLETDLPEIANARFDFSDGTFRDAQGGLIPHEKIDLWGDRLARSGRAGGGDNTVKRGIVLRSLLRAASEKRPAILEQVLRQSR